MPKKFPKSNPRKTGRTKVSNQNANCQVHLSLRAKDWGDGGAAPLAAFRRRLDWAMQVAGLLVKHRGQGGDIAAPKSSSLVIARLDRRRCTHCAAWTTRCSLPAVASRTCNARGCSSTQPSVAVLCIVAPSAKHATACDLVPISLGAKEAGVAVAAARPRILPPLVKRAG